MSRLQDIVSRKVIIFTTNNHAVMGLYIKGSKPGKERWNFTVSGGELGPIINKV